jgi:PTH1 family peptidyl-tRNA hydrolase
MYLIVGLGNPEDDYSGTRHNMGFDTINKLSQEYEIKIEKKKFDGLYAKAKIEGEDVILLKPQTYMNLSGKSIKQCSDFYKIKPENIIVIYDDIDIEKGIVKVRKAGGAGTHNGMKSVVECLGTQKFPRVRVGIGMPDHKNDLINYVIGNVPKEEKIILDKGCEIAKYAVKEILKNGIDNAMNKIN